MEFGCLDVLYGYCAVAYFVETSEEGSGLWMGDESNGSDELWEESWDGAPRWLHGSSNRRLTFRLLPGCGNGEVFIGGFTMTSRVKTLPQNTSVTSHCTRLGVRVLIDSLTSSTSLGLWMCSFLFEQRRLRKKDLPSFGT